MIQLVNNYCVWLHLMLLDRHLLHHPLDHLLLLPVTMVVVGGMEDVVVNAMVFAETIATSTILLKLNVVKTRGNTNNNQGLLLLCNRQP